MNKTVLITGATSGIGLACARKFAENGDRLILTGRNGERLDEIRLELEGKGTKVTVLIFDVRDALKAKECIGSLPDAWRDEFVHDNSYVGARIICLTPSDKTVDHLTESEKANIRGWLEVYAQGSPDGPFTLKKTCTWKFRLGRDSTYTYVDEIVETYQNAQECIDGILNHDASNPIFQSLYYYDAQKDEFILKDRTSWNLK